MTLFYKQIVTALFCFITGYTVLQAQQITGNWKGRIKSTNVELKIIKKGDSLTGTSYYYGSRNNVRRYTIKGYFDPQTNDAIWWDDELISGNPSSANESSLVVADFNCPGEGKMMLDGKSSVRDNKDIGKGPVHFERMENGSFSDEWDWVIKNYVAGANDPYIIDSIGLIARGAVPYPEETVSRTATAPSQETIRPVATPPVESIAPGPTNSSTNQQKLASRQKKLQMVIPVTAAQIELRFYDNAAIDGDSIAIFLNGKLVREHILLGGEAQIIKINTADLQEDNELVLVAENLGSIPPNTSYLVAIVGKKQYEGRLFADEGSSALIRFVKGKTED